MTITTGEADYAPDALTGPGQIRGRVRLWVDENKNGEIDDGEPILIDDTDDPPPPED